MLRRAILYFLPNSIKVFTLCCNSRDDVDLLLWPGDPTRMLKRVREVRREKVRCGLARLQVCLQLCVEVDIEFLCLKEFCCRWIERLVARAALIGFYFDLSYRVMLFTRACDQW